MSNQHLYVIASDVTGQRTAQWPIAKQALCGALVTQAVEYLRLPASEAGGESIIYHAFEETRGELLPSDERLEDLIQRYRIDVELRVRVVPELEAAT